MKKFAFIIFILFLSPLLLVSDCLAMEYRIIPVHPVMILPFLMLLLAMAMMPLVHSRWWDRYYPAVSLSMSAIPIFYYLFFLHNAPRILATGGEYLSFIILIGSLYVVAGGIHIRIKGRSTPRTNVILLGIGAVIANILGTTGASMVLIRPYIRVNRYRISGYHIVFFIFLISNIGGMLTPIGDPPLFLGYLKGVPFFWCFIELWPIWLFATSSVLIIFYLIDRYYYNKLPAELEHEVEEEGEHAHVLGLHNIIFLIMIISAVFLSQPLRELIMIGAALASYQTTRREIHERNAFHFAPLKEVAILFAGIFATMVPALDWLELNAGMIGITKPSHFYWGTGILSSFLDNAPTYLNFLTAAFGLHGLNVDNGMHMQAMLGAFTAGNFSSFPPAGSSAFQPLTAISWQYIQAISAASVIFGACTYIGNGPNFMVKAIAEHAHVKVPGFFEYMLKYSLPILIPIFAVIWYIFFV